MDPVNNEPKDLSNTHPCLACGACCSYYRVSFHPSETLPDSLEVPTSMVASVNSEESVMIGTNQIENTRCVALTGLVGKDGSCSIYENRPTPCRKFGSSYEHGVKEPRCDEARAAFKLPPLTLRDYDGYRNR